MDSSAIFEADTPWEPLPEFDTAAGISPVNERPNGPTVYPSTLLDTYTNFTADNHNSTVGTNNLSLPNNVNVARTNTCSGNPGNANSGNNSFRVNNSGYNNGETANSMVYTATYNAIDGANANVNANNKSGYANAPSQRPPPTPVPPRPQASVIQGHAHSRASTPGRHRTADRPAHGPNTPSHRSPDPGHRRAVSRRSSQNFRAGAITSPDDIRNIMDDNITKVTEAQFYGRFASIDQKFEQVYADQQRLTQQLAPIFGQIAELQRRLDHGSGDIEHISNFLQALQREHRETQQE